MIRTELVASRALHQRDQRLDAAFYCSGGAKARKALASSSIRLQPLASVCVPEGIYIPHRFKRPYVRDPEHGVPYLTGSDIVLADPLQGCVYLSRRPGMIPDKERLVLRPGTILVTSSGDPGRAVYVNELFAGAIGSPDILRIVPDSARIPPGYLFAFLASDIGRGLLTQGTYGGVIPHIEAVHVLDLPVPRLDGSIELAIHERIEQAAEKRVEANRRLQRARLQVYEATGLPPYERAPVGRNLAGARTFTVSHSRLGHRLEARYHDVLVREIQHFIRATGRWAELSQVTVDVYEEHRHKLFDAAENSLPFVGTGEMFSARPIPHRRVSKRIPGIKTLLVEQGTILMAKSGQIYSILGDVVFVGRTLARFAVSWHALRIIPDPRRLRAGFLFAFLSLPDYGYGQIVATAFGTSIPELSTEDVKRIVVPVPNEDDAELIDQEVRSAIELRDEANDLEDEAQDILSRALAEALSVPVPSPDGHGEEGRNAGVEGLRVRRTGK